MRSRIPFTALVAAALTSCMTYQGASVEGRWKDVSREDIAAAVAAARAESKRRGATLDGISVISSDEIHVFWASKEEDVIERVHGRWKYVITKINVG